MIEELKNANKVPGRTVWQLIARCEVLQTKLGEKEKEVEDYKYRIRELEQLLFSHHYPKYAEEISSDLDQQSERNLRPGNKVVKQYSQDEGRRISQEGSDDTMSDIGSVDRSIPHVKITRPASESSLSNDGDSESDKKISFRDDNFIKTSKITNVYEKGAITKSNNNIQMQVKTDYQPSSFTNEGSFAKYGSISEISKDDNGKTIKLLSEKIWDINPALDYTFSNETLVNHQIVFDGNDEITWSTRFKDEFSLTDSLNLNVHTIPEESEEEIHEASANSCSNNDISQKHRNLSKDSAIGSNAVTPHESDIVKTQIPRTCSVDNLSSVISKQHLSPVDAEESQGMKRLQSAPGSLHLENLQAGEAIDFLRMASMSSGFSYSDDTSSRRNSWTWGSEGDTDEEYASS
ncbi:cyclic nucleotide-gated olfactory channel [Caerostris darwini]|uniref:Cyclic nucleotide-gated olfactory channel n=1 Tax=Caerostris darwini TaxID=1538125 RepID=A0AAV4TJF4_9ARAC|nr:cyclic nucleotide-gated olfactory channel [Caerostris darwini]